MSECDEGWGTADNYCPILHSEITTREDGRENNVWCGFDPFGDMPDTCPYAPILKLLASAKEVSPDIEITFNNYENADDGEVVHFVIRR